MSVCLQGKERKLNVEKINKKMAKLIKAKYNLIYFCNEK